MAPVLATYWLGQVVTHSGSWASWCKMMDLLLDDESSLQLYDFNGHWWAKALDEFWKPTEKELWSCLQFDSDNPSSFHTLQFLKQTKCHTAKEPSESFLSAIFPLGNTEDVQAMWLGLCETEVKTPSPPLALLMLAHSDGIWFSLASLCWKSEGKGMFTYCTLLDQENSP